MTSGGNELIRATACAIVDKLNAGDVTLGPGASKRVSPRWEGKPGGLLMLWRGDRRTAHLRWRPTDLVPRAIATPTCPWDSRGDSLRRGVAI